MADLSVTTYATLLTTLASYAARDDLTTLGFWPLAVQLCEAKANRSLRSKEMEQRSTASVDMNSSEPEFVSLPSDYQSMRRVRLSGVAGKPALVYMAPEKLDEKRFANANVISQPQNFTIIGDEMELWPTPDSAYVIEMTYRKNIPALATNSSNWLLTNHPDFYLYGSLLEAEPYMKNDARIQLWGQLYSNVIADINRLGIAALNVGNLQMQVAGSVTP